MAETGVPTRLRLDKWLWAARFFRTRAMAQEAIARGQVTVNGQRPKPSREIALGDELFVQQAHVARTVRVTGLSDRRGSAPAAECLYMETPESREARLAAEARQAAERLSAPDYGRRPDKRGRRQLLGLMDLD